jgi:hypothetical protein
MLTGRASRGIGKALLRHGYRLTMPPESSQREVVMFRVRAAAMMVAPGG